MYTRPTKSDHVTAQAGPFVPVLPPSTGSPSGQPPVGGLKDYSFESLPGEKEAVQGLRDKYTATGDIVYLNMSKGLESMHISYKLYKKYEQSRELEYLSQAIKRAELAVSSAPHGTIPRALVSTDLGKFFLSRYEHCGTMEDLERALSCTREAVEALPQGTPERLPTIRNLGAILGARYQSLGVVGDLHEAIKYAEEAVSASSSRHPNRAYFLSNLGLFLQWRGRLLGSLEDFGAAINWAEQAVAVVSRYDPNRQTIYDNLGLLFEVRYEQLGTLEDLERANNWREKALEGTLPESPTYAIRLGNLGVTLASRYKRFGNINDLERALMQIQGALERLSPGYPHRSLYLCNLGYLLYIRYRLFGDVDDLKQGLMKTEEGVTATPLNSPLRLDWLNNLGMVFESRYQQFGHREDLDHAIENTEAAIKATPPNHKSRAMILGNLGVMLQRRYERYGGLESLDQGIRRTKEAMDMIPHDHPDRGGKLSNLALMLSMRYDQSNTLDDLHRAIQWAEDAISVIPQSHPDRRVALRVLGEPYRKRYLRLKGVEDLERAINAQTEAAVALPPSHPHRAYSLFVLSTSLDLRYQHSRSPEDLSLLLRMLYEAWDCRASPPSMRIMAAAYAATQLAKHTMWQESSSLISNAIRMLPNVRLRSLRMDDQEYRITKSIVPQLVTVAISLTVQAGEEASHCLTLLEYGRGLIMGLAIDCRSDATDLKLKYPKVFNRFDQLRTDINYQMARIEVAKNGDPSYEQTRRDREELVGELERTITGIRELPGFERFHLPPSPEELMSIAAEGPIIILNSTELRSDAIIVTNSAIRILPLPKLSYTVVEEKMSKISKIAKVVQGGPSDYAKGTKEMKLILEWLWDAIVEPVFQELNLRETIVDDDDLPRVWWIGVGLLALAPFHAAGYHSPRSTRNTLSRVISSYTPTIKALQYARQKKLQLLSKEDPRILAVAMPTTPGTGWKPLSNAATEIEDIQCIVGGKAAVTSLILPSKSRVLSELPSHDAIHLACHGVSDAKSPSNSALLLQGGDGTLDRLTVQTISSISIDHAQIAYLSACSTAENASNELMDESIFIASGFQLAGFSHVLATMWISNDRACRQVSGGFYRLLFDGRPTAGEGGHRKVSTSFHGAVKNLRDTYRKQPIKWASFIHTGA